MPDSDQMFVYTLLGGVYLLALARLTRLLTSDGITDWFRAWVFSRWGMQSTAAYFVECAWCVGMWVAAAGTPVYLWQIDQWSWLTWGVLTLAASQSIGLLAALDTTDDDVEIITDEGDTPA